MLEQGQARCRGKPPNIPHGSSDQLGSHLYKTSGDRTTRVQNLPTPVYMFVILLNPPLIVSTVRRLRLTQYILEVIYPIAVEKVRVLQHKFFSPAE